MGKEKTLGVCCQRLVPRADEKSGQLGLAGGGGDRPVDSLSNLGIKLRGLEDRLEIEGKEIAGIKPHSSYLICCIPFQKIIFILFLGFYFTSWVLVLITSIETTRTEWFGLEVTRLVLRMSGRGAFETSEWKRGADHRVGACSSAESGWGMAGGRMDVPEALFSSV